MENEENFSGYKVESSLDGVTFNFAGNVPAAGKHLYSFTVMPQLQKQHWYRLKMVDLDGSVSYSKTIRLQNTSAGQKLLIYPNPATEVLNISSTEKIIELRLSDASGRIYWQQKGNGMQTATVDIRSYAQGIYLLTVDTPTGKQTQRIIKSGK